MRAWAALVRFEVGRGWLVLLAGAVTGLAALAAPAVWGAGLDAPAEARGAAAPLLAFVLLVVAGGLLGARTLAGPVVSGTEGFFLAWPVGGGALWSARLAAAALLAGAAALLALLPVAAAQPPTAGSWLRGAAAAVPQALGAFLLAAAAAAVLRVLAAARSPWLLALIVAGAAAWRLVTEAIVLAVMAMASRGLDASPGTILGPAWGVALLAAVAGSLAASGGRGELGRAARWSGAVTSALLLAGAAAYAGWLRTALAPLPSEVVTVTSAATPPGGRWAVVAGVAPRLGLRPTGVFLVDLERGSWRTLGVGSRRVSPRDVAVAGPYLAHAYVAPRLGVGRVEVLRLEPGGARPVAVVRAAGHPVAVSPDGRLLALSGRGGSVWVVRVRDGATVRTVRAPRDATLLAFELDADGMLRAVAWLGGGAGPAVARLVSPPGGEAWREAWRVPGRLRGLAVGGGAALVVREAAGGAREASVRRLEDGRGLWRCEMPASAWPKLVDGGRLLLLPREGGREVSLRTPEGVAWRVEAPSPVDWSVAGGIVGNDVILVEFGRGGRGWDPGVFALDLRTGALHPLGRGTFLAGWAGLSPWPDPPLVERKGRLYRVTSDLRLRPVPVS